MATQEMSGVLEETIQIHDRKEITHGFRSLRSRLNVPSRERDIFSIFLFGDEYLSLLLEYYTYELIQTVNYRRFRLVLSQNGIKRIEEVAIEKK